MFCRNCGNQLDDNVKFCKYCGTPVTQKSEKVVQPEVYANHQNPSVEKNAAINQKAVSNAAPINYEKKAKKNVLGKILLILLLLLLFVALGFVAGKVYGFVSENISIESFFNKDEVIEEDEEDEENEENDEEDYEDEEDANLDESNLNEEKAKPAESEEAIPVVEEEQEDDADEMSIHTYYIVQEDVSWSEAYVRAISAGGYLVRINSEEEMEFIVNQIYQEGYENGIFWLGGMRPVGSSEYYWMDEDGFAIGEPLNESEFWLSGEPSLRDESLDLDENVMNMFYAKKQGGFVWNDTVDNVLDIVPSYQGNIGYIIEFEN